MVKYSISGLTREDATKRSIEDYSQFSQHARAAAQYVFAVNAGAAAAMLSFLTAITTATKLNEFINQKLIVVHLAIAASLYVGGVLLVLFSLFFEARAKQQWGHFWEEMANLTPPNSPVRPDYSHRFAVRGEKLGSKASAYLVASIVCLVAGSIACIWGFLR